MFVIPVTEFTRLKECYRSRIGRAVAVTVCLHVVLFVFFPPFEFEPYRLAAEPEVKLVETVLDVTVPLPPPSVPPPDVPVVAAKSDVDDDIIFPAFNTEDWDRAPLATEAPRNTGTFFVVEELPEVIELVRPRYPDLAREAGIEGRVRVRVTIDAKGRVVDVGVVSSDVTPAMERAALGAARRSKFKPARQRRRAVRATVVIPYDFRLGN